MFRLIALCTALALAGTAAQADRGGRHGDHRQDRHRAVQLQLTKARGVPEGVACLTLDPCPDFWSIRRIRKAMGV